MKTQVLDKLTSSKNERLAFALIFDRTKGIGMASKVILNPEFENRGIPDRKAINLAVNRLVKKGLVIKLKELMHNYDFDVYRYSINFQGVGIYLKGRT